MHSQQVHLYFFLTIPTTSVSMNRQIYSLNCVWCFRLLHANAGWPQGHNFAWLALGATSYFRQKLELVDKCLKSE